jgi:hypothetical protein
VSSGSDSPATPSKRRGSYPRWKHGTAGGYNNHRCRCRYCREAWRVYTLWRRKTGNATIARLAVEQAMDAARRHQPPDRLYRQLASGERVKLSA